ncbi:MAG: hypothetical protein KGJ86_14190 [Chloroflexota bacterium]|nr:hypothetical protein [Chloroflexota bacterium]
MSSGPSQPPIMMADPVWAYRKNYEPKRTLFEAIDLLQRHLAELPEETTTLEYLRAAFTRLWRMLEEHNRVVVTAHTSALLTEEQWLRCQQTVISRRRSA